MRHQPLHLSGRFARRLTDDQRRTLDTAATGEEYDTALTDIRLTHIENALAAAVAANRLGEDSARQIAQRLRAGEDPHAIRRELRAAGVLIRRSHDRRSARMGEIGNEQIR